MSLILLIHTFKNSSTPWFGLDVRSPEEYVQGSIPGAHNIPLEELASRLSERPRVLTKIWHLKTQQIRFSRQGFGPVITSLWRELHR